MIVEDCFEEGVWQGTILRAFSPVRIELCICKRAARRPLRRIRILASATRAPVLEATFNDDDYGFDVLRFPGPSLLPPIRAEEARRLGRAEDVHRWSQWLREYLVGDTSESLLGVAPLHPTADGSCGARRRISCAPLELAVAASPWASSFEWDIGDCPPPIALRAPDPSRVRVWRKHLEQGSLPPIFTFEVTGLATRIILDGHCRLQAALEEGIVPSFVTTGHVRPTRKNADAESASLLLGGYENAARGRRAHDEDRGARPFRGWTDNEWAARIGSALDDRVHYQMVSRLAKTRRSGKSPREDEALRVVASRRRGAQVVATLWQDRS